MTKGGLALCPEVQHFQSLTKRHVFKSNPPLPKRNVGGPGVIPDTRADERRCAGAPVIYLNCGT
ncbi:hypothetical protein J6590_032292 [Homalodisca vitripennis]|nr:hypothetical protein J6590_032292 [Homalodisca vitripennis]